MVVDTSKLVDKEHVLLAVALNKLEEKLIAMEKKLSIIEAQKG